MAIRGLVFDAYGTLYDVQSVSQMANKLCGAKGDVVTQVWRIKQLEYTWLRSLMGDYKDFWAVTRESLEFALESVGIEPTAAICDPLMQKYLALDLYPEAREALGLLKDYKLAILSNGSPKMLEDLVKSSDLTSVFTDVISIDRAKSYKPTPQAYALVEKALGITKSETLFVSSNSFDVMGAKAFGFSVAWVGRNAAAAPPKDSNIGPGEMFRLVRGGRETLRHDADHRIQRLTDLPGLVAKAKGPAAH